MIMRIPNKIVSIIAFCKSCATMWPIIFPMTNEMEHFAVISTKKMTRILNTLSLKTLK